MIEVILGSAQLVSYVLGAAHWKEEIITTKQVQLGYWGKGSTVSCYKVLGFLYL